MRQDLAKTRELNEVEILQALMNAKKLSLTEMDVTNFIQFLFYEADKLYEKKGGDRIVRISWKKHLVSGHFIATVWGKRLPVEVSVKNKGEEILAFLVDILSKIEPSVLEAALEKLKSDEYYSVFTNESSKDISLR